MIHQKVTRKTAFTLIELLVVISIIALLAAILFPVFGRARENARRASCLSNLKQIGIGIMQYTQDYDEKYPSNFPSVAGNGITQTDASKPGFKYGVNDGRSGALLNWVTWMDLIDPYVKSVQIYDCPSVINRTIPSYGYSTAVGGTTNSANYYGVTSNGPLSLASVLRPSQVFLLMDYNSIYSIYMNPTDVLSYLNSTDTTVVGRHFDGASICFTDGHVKWLSRERLKSQNNVAACGLPVTFPVYCSSDWNPYLS